MKRVLFVLTALLFVGALHVFICARTSWLWMVAILVGEWGHYAALLALLLAALSWWKRARFTAALALLTALMCLRPIISASRMAGSVESQVNALFGSSAVNGRKRAFDLLDLVRGFREGNVRVTEHAYADDGHKPLTLDFYEEKERAGPRPLILVVHGGSWSGGSKEQLPAINRYLAAHGYLVAALNYRHAPKSPFPAAVDDVFRALDFLKTRATEFQIDLTRIVIMGRSAGGEIALSAAYSGREPAIRGVIAFYAPTDLAFGYLHPSPRWVLDSKKVLRQYLGGTPAEKPAEYAAASPFNFVNANTPPTLLIHGQLDPLVWPAHSALLDERLQAAARPHFYLSLPWATHGCDANLSGPSGQLSLYAIERFLASVFTDR